MKKIKSQLHLIILIVISFSSNISNGQNHFFHVDTIYNNCNERIAARIWLKEATKDSFAVSSFYINEKEFSKSDTAIFNLKCYETTINAYFYPFNNQYYSDRIELKHRKCQSIDYLIEKNPGLDSSSQLGLAKLYLNDSNKNTTWQKLTIEQLSDAQGVIPIKTVKTFRLTEDKGILQDSFFTALPVGKYRYVFEGQNTSGCSAYTRNPDFWIGHHSSTRIDENGFIHDSIYYYHPAGNVFCELVNWWENSGCIDTNAFFYKPDSCTARRNWHTRSWYSAPAIKEAIYYDFNSDGIIDYRLDTVENFNHAWHGYDNDAIRIPAKYTQDSLTIWSRDSLGQWQRSMPIPYTNCSQFTRHDKLDFEPYYGECTFSSNGKYKAADSLNVVIKKIIINDTFFPVDRFTFQANLEVFKNLDYGMYLVERITNNTICDHVLKDTVFSCLNFQNIVTDSIFKDSIIIANGLKHSSDSILILITDTLNNWILVDSFWLRAGKRYVRTFPNGNYLVEYYSKNMICGKAKVHTLLNSSVEGMLAKNVRIFPNPTSENSNLIFPFESGNYKIIDNTGRTISNGNLVEGINEISLANLPKGLYIIEISHENNLLQKRLIKN